MIKRGSYTSGRTVLGRVIRRRTLKAACTRPSVVQQVHDAKTFSPLVMRRWGRQWRGRGRRSDYKKRDVQIRWLGRKSVGIEQELTHAHELTNTHNFVRFWQSSPHIGRNLMPNKESREDLNPTGELATADNITLDCWWRNTVQSTPSPHCTSKHRKPINA